MSDPGQAACAARSENQDQDSWEALRLQIGSLVRHRKAVSENSEVAQEPTAPPDQHDQIRILKKKLASLGLIDRKQVTSSYADQSPMSGGARMSGIPGPLRISAKAALATSLAGSADSAVSRREYPDKTTPVKSAPPDDADFLTGNTSSGAAPVAHPLSDNAGTDDADPQRTVTSSSPHETEIRPTSTDMTDSSYSGLDRLISDYRQDLHWRALNRLTPLRFLGWVLWAMMAISPFYLAVFEKEKVMQYWPKSRVFYDLFSALQQPDIPGIEGVSYRYALSTQGPVLELRGTLVNTGKKDLANPVIRIRALSDKGREMGAWLIDPEIRILHPSMETPFVGRSLVPEGTARIALYTQSSTGDTLFEDEITSDIFSLQPVSGGWRQSAPEFEGAKN